MRLTSTFGGRVLFSLKLSIVIFRCSVTNERFPNHAKFRTKKKKTMIQKYLRHFTSTRTQQHKVLHFSENYYKVNQLIQKILHVLRYLKISLNQHSVRTNILRNMCTNNPFRSESIKTSVNQLLNKKSCHTKISTLIMIYDRKST